MQSKAGAGLVAGLLGGVLFGILMQLVTMPNPEGIHQPIMTQLARVLGSENQFIGWLYHLFNSAVIGALFGWLFGWRCTHPKASLTWGAAYGFGWWIVGGLVLMPLLLNQPAFAPILETSMRGGAFGTLIGHLIYGTVTGLVYFWLQKRAKVVPIKQEENQADIKSRPAA